MRLFSEIILSPWSYWAGLGKYNKKNWLKAIPYFEKTLKSNPEHAFGNFKLAMCFFKRGEFQQAQYYFDTAVRLNPLRQSWQIQQQQCLRLLNKKGSFDALSESYLRAQLERTPNDANLYYELSKIKKHRYLWWQEIELIKQAIVLNGDNPAWHFRLGQVYMIMGQYNEASLSIQMAISLSKIEVQADWYFYLGAALEKSTPKDYLAIEASYEEAISRDKSLRAKDFGIGVYYQKNGNWSEAIKAYEARRVTHPLNAELLYRLGLSYDRCYQWEKAEDNYRIALTLHPEKINWHYRLGFVLERQAKYNLAAEAYQYAVLSQINAGNDWIYRWGYTLGKIQKYEEACLVFERLYPISKTYLREFNQETKLFSQNYKFGFENIKNELDFIVAKNVTSAETWYQLGDAYERLGEWAKAEESYQQALARANEHVADWYYHLGFVLKQQGKFKEAYEVFCGINILQKAYGVLDAKFKQDLTFRLRASYSEYYEQLNIKSKSILFESFHGASISCNPYAIFLEMRSLEQFKDWTFIWVINDFSKIPVELLNDITIIFIKREGDAYLRYLASAEIVVNNVTFPDYYIRKEDQKYLNTWHGTPIKYLGKDVKDSLVAHKNVARNFLQASHLINPNKYTTEILMDRYDISGLYQGILMETGYPRIDLTINQTREDKAKLRANLGIDDDDVVVLYAPTWRGLHGKATFNTDKLVTDLEAISTTGYKVLFRGHHMVEQLLNGIAIDALVVPSDVDTNTLLAVVDVLVTDYSSIAFDFIACKKPIFYYAYDLEKYNEDRGLYFSLNEMPGCVCETIENLVASLKTQGTQDVSMADKYLCAHNKYNKYDDGGASKRVIKLLFEKNRLSVNNIKDKRQNILIYAGHFIPNGITTSALNLIANINPEKFNIYVCIEPDKIELYPERLAQLKKLPSYVHLIGYLGNPLVQTEDLWVSNRFSASKEFDAIEMENIYLNVYRREFTRIFSRNLIDCVVNFEGYSAEWAAILAGADCRKIIYQHSDFYSEWKCRFAYLEKIFHLYRVYDEVVSVSEKIRDLNLTNLANLFNIPINKFTYAHNLQNPKLILEQSKSNIEVVEDDSIFTDSKCFITMGRLSIEKDHTKLIRAFYQVQKQEKNIKLIILGDGPLMPELKQLVVSLNLDKCVYLLGHRNNPFTYLKRSDCFVFSSNHEGQPMVLMEALILGLPVIATDIVGNRGVLEGKPGLLVENTINGLIDGMLQYLSGGLVGEYYDSEPYQKEAIDMFYKRLG